MEHLVSILSGIYQVAQSILSASFQFSGSPVQVGDILTALLILLVAFLAARYVQRILTSRVFPRFHVALPPNAHFLLMRLISFLFLVVAIMMAFNVLQIQLTGLTVVFGFLSVGIGFGLQNITSNFISGIILLFERPIRVGDRITVGDTVGLVKAINIRATLITTADNVDVIVPNSEFIEKTVINWTHRDKTIRLRVPVGVAYGSDTRLVKQLLIEATKNHSQVLAEPEPFVRFIQFGDSSLDFELLAWIPDALLRLDVISDLNFAIDDAFRANAVTVPFPQRDVHFFREE